MKGIMRHLGRPPMLSDSEEALYDVLLNRLITEIEPRDLISCILMRDLVCFHIEVERYRRISALLMQSDPPQPAREEYRGENSGVDEELEEMRPICLEESRGTFGTQQDVLIEKFQYWIVHYERATALYLAARKRFTATLADLERHQNGLGRIIREKLSKTIEGKVGGSGSNPDTLGLSAPTGPHPKAAPGNR